MMTDNQAGYAIRELRMDILKNLIFDRGLPFERVMQRAKEIENYVVSGTDLDSVPPKVME